jgi:hypothetical protein
MRRELRVGLEGGGRAVLVTLPILSPGTSLPHPLLQADRARHAPPPVDGERVGAEYRHPQAK